MDHKLVRIGLKGKEIEKKNLPPSNLDKTSSVLLETVVKKNTKPLEKTSDDFRFAAAVAGYGMLLKKTPDTTVNYRHIFDMARTAKGQDTNGYRAEFIRLVEMTELLDS